jgi:hypothetical protein
VGVNPSILLGRPFASSELGESGIWQLQEEQAARNPLPRLRCLPLPIGATPGHGWQKELESEASKQARRKQRSLEGTVTLWDAAVGPWTVPMEFR